MHVEETLSLLPYRDSRIRALIRTFKYSGDAVALNQCADAVADILLEELADAQAFNNLKNVLLVPVPASLRRLLIYRYSQTTRLAKAVIRRLSYEEIRIGTGLVKRIGFGTSQTTRTGTSRRKALAGLFAATKKGLRTLPNAHVILLDDVVTTGSTLRAVTKACKDAGAASVLRVAAAWSGTPGMVHSSNRTRIWRRG